MLQGRFKRIAQLVLQRFRQCACDKKTKESRCIANDGREVRDLCRWIGGSTDSIAPRCFESRSPQRESSIKLNNVSVRPCRPKSELPFTDGQLRQAGLAGQPTFPQCRSGLAPTSNAYEIALSCQRAARGGAHGTERIFIEYPKLAPLSPQERERMIALRRHYQRIADDRESQRGKRIFCGLDYRLVFLIIICKKHCKEIVRIFIVHYNR